MNPAARFLGVVHGVSSLRGDAKAVNDLSSILGLRIGRLCGDKQLTLN